MADVFISYKREDRVRIGPLARALEARGYTVWWDLELVAGQKWAKMIKAELDSAKCVIVAWTRASVADDQTYVSEWVENEADEALRRGVLVPALIDEGRIAWTHQKVQYATLIGWGGESNHPGISALIDGVVRHAGVRAKPEEVELAAWNAAERSETAEAFLTFVSAYPHSRFAEIARGRTAELDEAAAWSALGGASSVGDIADFLRRHPAGRFTDEAKTKLKALELAAAREVGIDLASTSYHPMPDQTRLNEVRPARPDPLSDLAEGGVKARLARRAGIFVAGVVAVVVAATGIIAVVPFDPSYNNHDGLASVGVTDVMPPPPPYYAGQGLRECGQCPELVVLAGGTFTMGTPTTELAEQTAEGPLRRVTVGPFAAGKFEVTFDNWNACVSGGGCTRTDVDSQGWLGGNRPVIDVSWEDAQQYVLWLSHATGQAYRLLTEAEWEFAASAGTTTMYGTGATITASDAVFSSRSTAGVGEYPANRFGLFDMHGNVSEWVQDCWNVNYIGGPRDGSAWMSGQCLSHVTRGGSWHNENPLDLRASKRDGQSGESGGALGTIGHFRTSYTGFRVARTL